MFNYLLAPALLSGILCSAVVAAQSFPNQPINVVIGYSPGGSADFVARLMAKEMANELNVPLVVENKPGAGGNIANAFVARAAPDGYTVLLSSHLAVNKILYPSSSYDPDTDFTAVTRLTNSPLLVLVKNDLPVKDLKELVSYAQTRSTPLFNASAGFGSAPHLASALFESVTGVKFDSIQYKGGGPAAVSLMAGETDVLFAVPPTVMGQVKAKRMRALAITKAQASLAVPDIPGAEEAGLPGYEYTFWYGLFVPSGTPDQVVERLHKAAVAVLAKPDVKQQLRDQGMDVVPSASPQSFSADIKAEASTLEAMLQSLGAKVE